MSPRPLASASAEALFFEIALTVMGEAIAVFYKSTILNRGQLSKMAENEDFNLKNRALDFKRKRGIYIPVTPTTPLPIKVLSSLWQWVGFGDKTFWNWLELLIVPLFLAGGAFYLEKQTEARQEQIATNRYQQEALAKYLDQMTALLLDENLREAAPDSEASSIARARTITALQELDGERKGLLIRFLQESNLISTDQTNQIVVSLNGADLSGASLSDTSLSEANLSEANLSGANLYYASLNDAYLRESNLSGASPNSADLIDANLHRANLSGANLSGANLHRADLSESDLSGANLHRAYLGETNLSSANLDGTNLDGAFLCRTIMPDGKVDSRSCMGFSSTQP